jgi:dihydrodipicolinate synthase/N-acetylneuraminate lyase
MPADYETAKQRITGPVFPVVTPFTENGDVDHQALTEYVNFLVEGGAPVVLVTVGTSRFNLLTREEMKAVNETVVEATSGEDVFTIVAGPGPSTGSTRENKEFAEHAESIGANALIVVYPERWYGKEPVVKFLEDISRDTDISLMIHAVPMRDGFGGVEDTEYYTVPVIREIAEIDGVIGLKEESGKREIYEALFEKFNDQLAIIGAGGSMDRYLTDSELGATTYLVGIGSFLPELAVEFFEAIEAGNRDVARQITQENEAEYFETAVEMGWHRALKETLHQFGLMKPFERDPLNRIPPEDRNRISDIIDDCGWQ